MLGTQKAKKRVGADADPHSLPNAIVEAIVGGYISGNPGDFEAASGSALPDPVPEGGTPSQPPVRIVHTAVESQVQRTMAPPPRPPEPEPPVPAAQHYAALPTELPPDAFAAAVHDLRTALPAIEARDPDLAARVRAALAPEDDDGGIG